MWLTTEGYINSVKIFLQAKNSTLRLPFGFALTPHLSSNRRHIPCVEFNKNQMSINTSKLSSTFKTDTLEVQKTKALFRRQQAAFYSLRTLMWDASKGKVFKDALDAGLIEQVAPGYRLPDGSFSRPEYNEDEIAEVYSEAWTKFKDEFDEAFIHATAEEIGEYSFDHFGQDLQALLKLNDLRMAERHNR